MKNQKSIKYIILIATLAVAPTFCRGEETAKNVATQPALDTHSARSENFDGRKMDVLIFNTRMDLGFDWWTHVPLNSPRIITSEKVYRGDVIAIIPSVAKFTKKENEEFSLKISGRGGSPDNMKSLGEKTINGVWPHPENLRILNEFMLGLAFSANDSAGPQKLEITVENLKTGEKATESVRVSFLEWESPATFDDEKKLSREIFEFNKNYKPETLYSIFASPKMTFVLEKPKGVLNPILLSFFKNAFSANKFLIPILRKEFDTALPQVRANTIILFSILGEKEFEKDKLNANELALQKQIREMKPLNDPYKEIKNGYDIDMLWGEFFARGTYAPARRILDALLMGKERDFANEKMVKHDLNKNNPDDIAKLERGIAAMSAEWSVVSNTRNELFTKYLSWAVKNDSDATLKNAIGLLFDRAKKKAEAKARKSADYPRPMPKAEKK